MTEYRFNNAKLNGEITVPPSKSYLNRYLLAAALSEERTVLNGYSAADDAVVAVNGIRAIGADVSVSESGYKVTPIWNNLKCKPRIDCGESATALRFLLPICCAVCGGADFVFGETLRKRCASAFAEAEGFGIKIVGDSVSGELKSGVYRVSGEQSSQLISGLLFALPLLRGDSEIHVSGKTVSRPYLKMTVAVLREFSIKVERTDYGYFVKGGQKYLSPREVFVEGDWSLGAVWLIGGILSGLVGIKNLRYPSLQGDSVIVDIIREAGGDIRVEQSGIFAKKSRISGFSADCSDCPDLAPLLAVMFSEGDCAAELVGVSRLRYKESDRLSAARELVGDSSDGDSIIISGRITGGRFDGRNDHRMVFATAIAALTGKGNRSVSTPLAVAKSYPDFWTDYVALGGRFYE